MPPIRGDSSDPSVPAVYGEHHRAPKRIRKEGPEFAVVGSSSGGFAGVHGHGGENGVFGLSEWKQGSGVFGSNPNGNGIAGYSEHGVGVKGVGNLAGRFEGDIEVTGEIRLTGADCAEEFPVADEADPGTVVVIDDSGALVISRDAYDTRVAGVIAGAGSLKPCLVLDSNRGSEDGPARKAISLTGKTHCRVDARQCAVAVGDLLTTADLPGYAMLAADRNRSFGAVIGKALAPLHSGLALIPILVALQ